MKLVTVEPSEYLFAYRMPAAQAWAAQPNGVVMGAGAPLLLRLEARRVCGLAIAPQSEVRAVRALIDGEWVELVEGAPLTVTPGAVRGELQLDRLDWHDGRLVLQVAEDACELPLLSRWVAPYARLSAPLSLAWPQCPSLTLGNNPPAYFLHVAPPRGRVARTMTYFYRSSPNPAAVSPPPTGIHIGFYAVKHEGGDVSYVRTASGSLTIVNTTSPYYVDTYLSGRPESGTVAVVYNHSNDMPVSSWRPFFAMEYGA